jgi:hypothetical protein
MQAQTIKFSKTHADQAVNGKVKKVQIQAADIVFKYDSAVTNFELVQPKVKNESFELVFGEDFHCSFNPSKYGQMQANMKPANIEAIEQACVEIVEYATATPHDKSINVSVKPISWGADKCLTVTWPHVRGKAGLKSIPTYVNGVKHAVKPEDFVDQLELEYRITKVVVNHTWYALRRAEDPSLITISHRLEVQEIYAVDGVDNLGN